MRDENQCLHERDAHASLAFASHTLSSHFRMSEFRVVSEWDSLKKKISAQPIIPKAACFWTLGEEHRASLRARGTACVLWPAPWFQWEGRDQVGQSPHGRDGHAPFFCGAKFNFKETLV